MNSGFQLLKGETDGEKSTSQAEHKLFFQGKKMPHNFQKRED